MIEVAFTTVASFVEELLLLRENGLTGTILRVEAHLVRDEDGKPIAKQMTAGFVEQGVLYTLEQRLGPWSGFDDEKDEETDKLIEQAARELSAAAKKCRSVVRRGRYIL